MSNEILSDKKYSQKSTHILASNKLNNSTILKKTKKSLPNKKSSGILSDRDGMVVIMNDVQEY